MSTVELKLSNVNGTPPTILQLTTDDVCDLFDKLLSKLSSNKSNVKLDNIIFELKLPIELLVVKYGFFIKPSVFKFTDAPKAELPFVDVPTPR